MNVNIGMTWFKMRFGAKRASSERRRRVRLCTCGFVEVRMQEINVSIRKAVVSIPVVVFHTISLTYSKTERCCSEGEHAWWGLGGVHLKALRRK